MATMDSQGGDEFERDVGERVTARSPDGHFYDTNDVEVTDVAEITVETTDLGTDHKRWETPCQLPDHSYANADPTVRGNEYEEKRCASWPLPDGCFYDTNMYENITEGNESEADMEEYACMLSSHEFCDINVAEVTVKTTDLGTDHKLWETPCQLPDHSYANADPTVSRDNESETDMEDCSTASPPDGSIYDSNMADVTIEITVPETDFVGGLTTLSQTVDHSYSVYSTEHTVRGNESETDMEDCESVQPPDGCFYDTNMAEVTAGATSSRKYAEESAMEHAQTSVKSHHPVGFSLPTGTSDIMYDDQSDEEFEDSEDVEVDSWNRGEHNLHQFLMLRGWHVKPMIGDGACMFRAVAHQLFGDEKLHSIVRKQCMDYIVASRHHFENFIVENFEAYVARKRQCSTFGNHIELQAMSSLYNRTIEIYSGNAEPIIITAHSGEQERDPIRLSYHNGQHYNSIITEPHPTLWRDLGSSSFKGEESGLHEEFSIKEDVGEKRRLREILACKTSIKVYIDNLKEDANLIQQIIDALEEKLGPRKRDASVKIATIRSAQQRYQDQLWENYQAQRRAIEEYRLFSDAVARHWNETEDGTELSRTSSKPSPAFPASESYDSPAGTVRIGGSEEDPMWCSDSSDFNAQVVDNENAPSYAQSTSGHVDQLTDPTSSHLGSAGLSHSPRQHSSSSEELADQLPPYDLITECEQLLKWKSLLF